jgi:predicted nucleic acid-binding protein
MSGTDVFFDTNVLLYLSSSDQAKVATSHQLMTSGGRVSVQVLDEAASVMSRKHRLPWPVVRHFLTTIRSSVELVSTDIATHELGLDLAERYRFSVYDSMLLAAALQAGCTTFYSEDLHDGQVVENTLTIRNPFR